MREEIISIKNEALAQIMEAKSATELEEIRISYLGRNGKFTKAVQKIKDVPKKEKKECGILLNEAKNTLIKLLSEKKNSLTDSVRQWFDPTVPGKLPARGHLHLVTNAIEEISLIFEKIGFTRVRYPEVEWDWFAFESLNMPKDHPARDEWETFFVDSPPHTRFGQMLLTPHTSSGQVREMQRKSPPIRMINIAKCFRRQSDNTHSPMFHQFEGLVIDKDINITHLKWTIDYFAKQFYGEGVPFRIRPFHFQFTEPSFEVDFGCTLCKTKGCKFCKSGWHEVGGAGMVHPQVLKNGGVDPAKYSGFAFGWGVERTYMMRAGLKIDDIRQLYSCDLRYLRQF